ncbi:alpha/beta hydrolase [Streptomyces sp. B6B3]|uniref:alpha/beta fold hydrolase n=1 Tax=Streptomyces sp. B6B3 TaxID=3153570 RepID=UPI00325E2485
MEPEPHGVNPADAVPRSEERMVEANGVRLCVQTFGHATDPPLLLVAGAASPMDWWDEELCRRLAAGPRYVVRYDHRDTGRSDSFPPGAPPYTGRDLVEDQVGVLDALGLPAAHLVGISMGGALAQCVALDHPDRVSTLTLVATSPAVPVDVELPPMADRLRPVFAEPAPPPDWTDRAAVVDHLVESERPFAGSLPFDEERLRELAGRIHDRTPDMATADNHWAVDEGEPYGYRLDRIAAPTLVLHGTDDPLFPYGHGEALAAAIPGARLVPLEGCGHQMPPRSLWDVVVREILRQTGSGAAGGRS